MTRLMEVTGMIRLTGEKEEKELSGEPGETGGAGESGELVE